MTEEKGYTMREKTGEDMTRRTIPGGWKRFAAACAQDATENHFESRRGVWGFTDLPVVVIYNNNPYTGSPKLRGEELAKFRAELSRAGIKELGYGTAGGPGDDLGGYTFALVIEAGNDATAREAWCVAVWQRIFSESLSKMTN
jgi:hypothetical protein